MGDDHHESTKNPGDTKRKRKANGSKKNRVDAIDDSATDGEGVKSEKKETRNQIEIYLDSVFGEKHLAKIDPNTKHFEVFKDVSTSVTCETKISSVLVIPYEQESIVYSQLEEACALPDFKIQAVDDVDGTTTLHANASVGTDGIVFKTLTAEARASVLYLVQTNGKPIEQVNVDVFTVGVGARTGTYLGAEAGVSLIKAQASIFDLNLGLGVDTGFGIKDDSVDVHYAGCGFQFGRKVSVSAFGSSFGIDFDRLF
ncbi:hypothetical protein BGZ46_004772 [Entomortierella lignicola]|nr:hypothetical protein BGZ46_004772 [Entomortierella lignicola]